MKSIKKYMLLSLVFAQGLSVQNMYGYISQKSSRDRQAQLIASGKLSTPGIRNVRQPVAPVRPALKELAPRESLSTNLEDTEERQKWLTELLAEPTVRPKKEYKVRKSSGRIALENMIQNKNSMLTAFNGGSTETQKWLDQALKVLLGERNPVLTKSNVDFVRKHLEEATREELEYSFNAHPGTVPQNEQTSLLDDMKREIYTFIKSRL